jgi:polypeptide N-acetylgalactosaminyltransferase
MKIRSICVDDRYFIVVQVVVVREAPAPPAPLQGLPHEPPVNVVMQQPIEHNVPSEHNRNNNNALDNGAGVLPIPKDPNGPGEMGKPVVLPSNMSAEQKRIVDEGWQNNAFNQYISDMISVHRSLPDPRDEW